MEFLLILVELGLLGIKWVGEVHGTSFLFCCPLFKGNVPWEREVTLSSIRNNVLINWKRLKATRSMSPSEREWKRGLSRHTIFSHS